MKTENAEYENSPCVAGRNGSALLVVMGFAAILLVVTATVHKMAGQSAKTVANFRRSGQALAIAEAGVSDALKKLAMSYDTYKISTIVATNFAGGSYVVNITTNGRTGSIIQSSGTYDGLTVLTVLESLGSWQSAWDTNTFGKYGIFAKGLADENGNGILHASIYSGTAVEIAPPVTIEGSVASAGTILNQGTIGGASEEYSDEIPPPTFSFEYYKSIALTFGGDFYAGDVTFKDETVQPASGVTAVAGEVKIQNGAIIKGAIVALGDIVMTGGQIDHEGLNDPISGLQLPSLMSISNDVTVLGGQTLNGFVYAKGDVQINGGDIIYGGVIAGGIVDARGNWEIYPGPGVVPPGINPAGDGDVTKVKIGAWLR